LAALNNPDDFEAFDDTFVKAMKVDAPIGDDEDGFWGGGSDEYYSDEEYEGYERGAPKEITDLDTRPERGEHAQIFDQRFEKVL